MAVTLLPDVEAIVSLFFRQHEDVVALVGQKVYGELPTKTEPVWPAVLITRVAGAPIVNTHTGVAVLDSPLVQVDVWGGTKAQARTIAATCRAALPELPGFSQGAITGVRLGTLAYQADTDYSPPKPRYRFDFSAFIR